MREVIEIAIVQAEHDRVTAHDGIQAVAAVVPPREAARTGRAVAVQGAHVAAASAKDQFHGTTSM